MLDQEDLNNFKEKYQKDPHNKIRRRMLNKVRIVDVITDEDTTRNTEFNINIKTNSITDQKESGRCWIFAGMNILREKIIKNCNLDNFELSGSFIAFHDKLERFNTLLERLISYKSQKKDVYDKDIAILLNSGLEDGGDFSQFAKLIQKYGIVPKGIFPESYASLNTDEINEILSRLLRKFYLEIEHCDQEKEQVIKKEYLEKAYFIIANTYGIPKEKFNFEYTDKDRTYHIDKNLTPKEFYNKYIGVDFANDYIEITSYQDEKIKYNNLYLVEESKIINDQSNTIILNLPQEEFRSLLIEQLKNNEPVDFSCSTTTKRISGVWLDLLDRYGEIFDIDLTLNKNEILRTRGITGAHCMIFTGVNLIEGQPIKWKVENSWGEEEGKNGYWVATDDWVEKYVYRIAINKKYLTEQQLNLLKQEPITVTKWDIEF